MKQEFITAAEQLSREYLVKARKDKTTLFVGDSFFDKRYFWTDFEATFLGCDAVCAGIGSTTTYDWAELFPKYFSAVPPKNLVINLGTNNFYDVLDTAEVAQINLQNLLTSFCGLLPQTNVYYFSISQRLDKRFAVEVSQTNAVMKEWCVKHGVTFVDVESLLTEDLLLDGVHPVLQAYGKVFLRQLSQCGCVIEKL